MNNSRTRVARLSTEMRHICEGKTQTGRRFDETGFNRNELYKRVLFLSKMSTIRQKIRRFVLVFLKLCAPRQLPPGPR